MNSTEHELFFQDNFLKDVGQVVVVELFLVLVDQFEVDGLGGHVREFVVEANLVVANILGKQVMSTQIQNILKA